MNKLYLVQIDQIQEFDNWHGDGSCERYDDEFVVGVFDCFEKAKKAVMDLVDRIKSNPNELIDETKIEEAVIDGEKSKDFNITLVVNKDYAMCDYKEYNIVIKPIIENVTMYPWYLEE